MTVFLLCIFIIILIIATAEVIVRIYYRFRFLIPFRSKSIGEYPYSKFIEKVAPPLQYRMKKGFRSPAVNINRFRCRGQEPSEDGTKKRIMVIGESIFFGVKLKKEEQLWSVQLEKMLKAEGFNNWEVLNAGNPTYNSLQHRILWEQDLKNAKPDILLIEIGANDVTQAWMMGAKWKPGTPWPWKFIMALERKSPWWNRLLSFSCLYFFFRRNMTERKNFPRWDKNMQWENCLDFVRENYGKIVEDAEKSGTKVACIPYAPAYDPDTTKKQARCLEAIQANWENFTKDRAKYDYGLLEFIREKIRPDLNIPYIDLTSAFKNHPQRYQLYFDLMHFNSKGMELVAKTIFNSIVQLGWIEPHE